MPDDAPRPGPSKEAWAAITAVAVALISAVVTLATHFWSPSAPPTATPNAPDSPAMPSAASLAGRWSGTATGDGGVSYRVHVEIAPGCAVGARCGEIAVSSVPCRGALYLQTASGSDFEFRVQDFVAPSGPQCQSGAGEHLQPQPDGTLVYATTYEPRVRAVLARAR